MPAMRLHVGQLLGSTRVLWRDSPYPPRPGTQPIQLAIDGSGDRLVVVLHHILLCMRERHVCVYPG
jgi:hypothetical protein